jgi:hypothetical protein
MATKKKGLLAAAGNAGGDESGPFILSGIDQTQTPVTHAWTGGSSITLGQGIWFNPNGTKMWIYGTPSSAGDYIYQYDLSTAWDTNSYTFSASGYSNTLSATARSFSFSDDGTHFYWNYGYTTSYVKWRSIDSADAFDIGATTTGGTSIIDNVGWFYVKGDDGTRTWHTNFGSRLYTNPNSTNWVPITSEYTTNYEDLGYTFNKFQFADSGSMLFVYDMDNNALVRYTLSTAYDTSTLNFEERVVISDMKTGTYACFFVSTDGDYLFYANTSSVLSRISFE